jgi:hypothetical protein
MSESSESLSCPVCDTQFNGKQAGHNLVRHVNARHLDEALPEKLIEYLANKDYKTCDTCGEYHKKKHGKCQKGKENEKEVSQKKRREEEPILPMPFPSTAISGFPPTATSGFAPKPAVRSEGRTDESSSIPIDPVNSTVFPSHVPSIKVSKYELSEDLIRDLQMIPKLGDIPEQVQPLAGQVYSEVVNKLRENIADPKRWLEYMVFSHVCLIKDVKLTGSKKKSRVVNKVKRRLYLFLEGKVDELIDEAFEIGRRSRLRYLNSKKSTAPESRWINLVRHGSEKTVIREMNNEQRVQIDETAERELKSKFPHGEELEDDPEIEDERFDPIQITDDDVMKAAAGLRKRSHGSDGMSGNVLLQLLRSSATLLVAYTELTNIMLDGRIPKEIMAIIPIRGIALQKKPRGVRPLGVPLIQDGLLTKAVSMKKKKVFQSKVKELCPTQLALAPRGAEIATHVVRDYAKENSYPGSKKAIVQTDLSNCFNLLLRYYFVPLFKKHFPFIYRYFFACYSRGKKVNYGHLLILILTGLLQGCGLSPLTCAICLAALFSSADQRIRRNDPGAVSVALMDDLTMCADEQVAVDAMVEFSKEGPGCGAFLNPPKTVIASLDPLAVPVSTFPFENVQRVTIAEGFDVGSKREEDGTRMLGSPIGTKAYCESFLLDRFKIKYTPLFEKIETMNHPHAAWRMFQQISAQAGMIHIFRTTPTDHIQAAFPEIENALRSFLGKAVFGCELTDTEWSIVQLPYDLGGWNVTPLEILAPSAYLASLLNNRDEILAQRPQSEARITTEIQETIALIIKTCPNAKLPELKANTKQREIVKACMEARAEEMLAKVDQRTRALLRGQQQQHAAKWKTAAHTAEMFIPSDQFQISAQYSIGHQIPFNAAICPCCNKVALDAFGDHALICMKTGDVVHRHNDLYRVIVAEARAGMMALSVENTILKTADSSYKADILLPRGIEGYHDCPLALDLTASCPMNQSMVARAAKQDLIAAETAATRKDKEQKDDLAKLHYGFMPLPFETTGGHTEEVAVLVHHIAKQKAIVTGVPFGEIVNRIWELLAVTLQRANSFAIKKRYLELPPSDDELP